MRKWALSAIVYLFVVVGGYYTYTLFVGGDLKEANHAGNEQHNNKTEHSEANDVEGHEKGHGEGHSEHSTNQISSELLPVLHEENGQLVITLKDQLGKPVADLEVNHEKLMHLIVVSTDLKEYKHLHPESNEPGVFKVAHTLAEGEYKVFVDIKPKDLAYQVQPINLMIGSTHKGHEHSTLQPDSNLAKQMGDYSATLLPTSQKTNEEIQLKFDLNGETPEQYLGALGHVVILDEKANNYIHVHPLEGTEPVFETKFTDSGIYKIWAEFKFNGEVFAFPYVLEIK
jgi:hypothetical protein